MFFTESGQSPTALQKRTERVLTGLLPQTLARITDTEGETVQVTTGAASGVIGRDYRLHTPHAQLRVWIGLNVHRVIVILFCARPDGFDDQAFDDHLRTVFFDTIKGARAIGYDEEHIQIEHINDCHFASIWLTWDIGTTDDFLTHSPSQLFFAQDVALMVQSFLRTAQRRGLQLWVPVVPMPL